MALVSEREDEITPELEAEVDHETCNYLARLYHERQSKHTRYHKFDEIHVSDIIDCPVKVVVFRVFEITPPCRLLYYMKEGLEWEKTALGALQQMFPTGRIYDRKEVPRMLTPYLIYKLVGTPDFVAPGMRIIEVKWTRFAPWDIRQIFVNKLYILDEVKNRVPEFRNADYPTECKKKLIFPGWYYQLAGYYFFTHRNYATYLYANRGHHIQLIKVDINEEDRDFLETQLSRVLWTLRYYKDKLYLPLAKHPLEKLAWDELRHAYELIWKDWRLYLLVEYRCRYCPLAYIKTCPGVVPLKLFWNRKIKWLWAVEEIERLRFLCGLSYHLQEYIKSVDPELYELITRGTRADLRKIRGLLRARHNDPSFIAGMIAAVKQDAKFFGIVHPVTRRYIYLH